ncbi:MAG: helix-turn-helix domain-containing protein [Candidatus Woesearchaeota archaeon]
MEIFKKIGLTDGEIKVYLALLKIGSSTTGPIVDKSGVSRSKVYNLLERLMRKGLVSYVIKSKTKYFQAADPEKLVEFLNFKEMEIKDSIEELEKIIPSLKLEQSLNIEEEAEIFKGLEGIKSARDLALNVLNKGETFYCLGANKENQEPLNAYWIEFHKKRKRKGIKAKYIVQEDSRKTLGKQKEKSGLIEVKYLDIAGPVHIDIFNDYVVTCIMKGTYTSFLLKNKYAARYYRDYFEKAWELAKK